MNPTQAVFTPPATNKEDNSAIANGEIVKYTLAVGLVPTDGSPQTFPIKFDDTDLAPAPDGTIAIPLDSLGTLAPGSYMGEVTATTAAGVTNAPIVAPFTIAPPVLTPNACTDLKFV